MVIENDIEKVLKEHISEQNVFFVFPTQTAATLWADRIIEISDTKAVGMERFIAWDKFKESSIKAKKQDKKSIPSSLRLIFARNIIEINKKEKIFKNIINPEYAGESDTFYTWISGVLPGLALWKLYFDKKNAKADAEDEDLLVLYERYNSFLNENGLFDPAWEFPPFENDGNHYFIFYPEILSDYCEYEKILRNSESITEINLNTEKFSEAEKVYVFSNFRKELRNIVLNIRKYHDQKNIPFTEMALSVPDLENYGPYIEKELNLYEIPHVLKFARPLTSFGAGCMFSQINACISSECNYESLVSFLLNTELPWKDEESINQLLEFGKKNHCICNFEYNGKKVNVWAESFKERTGELRAQGLYNSLVKHFEGFKSAASFTEIRSQYFAFRQEFFDMSKCTRKSDLIISRCISELGKLIDLEMEYPHVTVKNPLAFFVNYLDDVDYLEQSEKLGLQIFPYKMAATAPFKIHFIMDASQAALSVVYKELTFLREDKRVQILGKEDPNVTENFIRLYQMNSTSGNVFFTASERTLTGYSQSCSYLVEEDCKSADEADFEKDFFNWEKQWLREEIKKFPEKIFSGERTGYENWRKNQKTENYQSVVSEEIINERLHEHKLSVSNTMLKNFYDCPRIWFFKSKMKLEKVDNAATLMDNFAEGNLYHKIFELYCQSLKKKNKVLLTDPQGNLLEEYVKILDESIDAAIEDEDTAVNDRNAFITKEMLRTIRPALRETMINSVKSFSSIFHNCRVISNEEKLFYEPAEKNYSCNGRVDCLLQSEDNNHYFLVDFKSSKGSIPTDKFMIEEPDPDTVPIWNNAAPGNIPPSVEEFNLPDFQMPMYVYLYENRENPKTIENVAFFDVSKGECYPVYGEDFESRLPKKNGYKIRADFDDTIETLVICMDNLAERIEKGNLEINKYVQDFSKCSRCDFKAICRRSFNVGRKD